MLLKMFSGHRPSHILLARDTKDGSFRNELYTEYKANRDAPPEELIPQFALIDELVNKMGFPNLSMKGYEADDIIGSAVTQYRDQFDEILIASGDKDLMQFVDDKIKMLDTMKDKIFGRAEVFEKMGVYPEQIVDYLSIVGDSSDNIPGMKGIGAKGAATLLGEYGNLDTCIENKDKLKGKRLINAFENHLEDAKLSKELIQIVTDLDLGFEKEGLKYDLRLTDELTSFLKDKLGFNRAYDQLKEIAYQDSLAEQSDNEGNFHHIDTSQSQKSITAEIVTDKEYKDSLKKIKKSKKVALFTAFDEPKAVHAEVVGLGIALDSGENLYFPFDHYDDFNQKSIEENLSGSQLEEVLDLIFSEDDRLIISMNSKRDLSYNIFSGLKIKSKFFDITQAHYVLDVSAKHTLEYICERYLEYKLDELDKKEVFANISLNRASSFIGQRTDALFQLYESFTELLEKQSLGKVFYEIDMPVFSILAEMETKGIHINPEYLKTLETEFSQEIKDLEATVEALSGEEVNLRSPKQLSQLLFEKLEYPIIKKTKTGASTDSSVLEELVARGYEEIPSAILRYRELDKLLSTYVTVLPKLVHPETHRIHTTFNQHVAATGRLSSDHPNLQNIPIRSENGRKVRKAFIATPGNLLLGADYSQVELRILAHFSQDPAMVEAFIEGIDIHTRTASEVLGVPLDKVTSDQRASAKAVNFGLMYGQSSFGLAAALKISRKEARDYITMYFERFSKVKAFLDSLKEKCEEKGYAETLFGRKRFLPDIKSSNRTVKSMAERVAINSPIQGTAADILKIAMIKIHQQMKEQNLQSSILLQVHDELIFEVQENEVEQMKKLVKEGMENAVKLSVPLDVDMGLGVDWYNLK